MTYPTAKTDEIAWRRFGPAFERKCVKPETIICARWPCQMRNRCQHEKPEQPTKDAAA